MERVLSPEDRIRRAEELVELRRRTGNYSLYTNKILKQGVEENVIWKKKVFIKKIVIQIVLCIIIYTFFFMVKNYNVVFSKEIIKNIKHFLSYDVDFKKVYKNGMDYLEKIYNKNNSNAITTDLNLENESNDGKENNEENKEKDEDAGEVSNKKQEIDENEQKENEKQKENDNKKEVKTEELSQMEQDAKYVKENINLIKPLDGIISSEFGKREDENPIVTEIHNGIDIAAVTGTKIKSSMDGVVDIAATSSSYGKYIEITNNNIKTLYAHCNKLYVKKGDKVIKGQEIAEVGQTR